MTDEKLEKFMDFINQFSKKIQEVKEEFEQACEKADTPIGSPRSILQEHLEELLPETWEDHQTLWIPYRVWNDKIEPYLFDHQGIERGIKILNYIGEYGTMYFRKDRRI